MAKDLSHLPRAQAQEDGGNTPLRTPLFGHLAAHLWQVESDTARAQRPPRQPMHPTYHSDAGKCSFQIGLILEGFEGRGMDVTGHWNVRIGSIIHDEWQRAMTVRYGDWVAHEVRVGHWHEGEKVASGRIDTLVLLTGEDMAAALTTLAAHGIEVVPQRDDCLLVSIEAKSVNGYGFKTHVGAQGEAQGPATGALLQGALGALAVGADVLLQLDLAKECISESVAKKNGITSIEGRFVGEWAYTRPEYERLAKAELKRLIEIRRQVRAGEPVPRYVPLEMPKGARITAPSKGNWQLVDGDKVVDAGSYFGCGYCPVQEECIKRNKQKGDQAA